MKTSRDAAYRALFTDVYPDALRFAERRSDARHAEEAVANAMMVAWRRFDDAPASLDGQRAWVFGIVRKTLLNEYRGQSRQDALAVRVADDAAIEQDHAPESDARIDLARAWRTLDAAHQEALSLAVFEDLTAKQAATVLGISSVAFRARLMRARTALKAAMQPVAHHAVQPLVAEEAR